jgi:hypothetical protein
VTLFSLFQIRASRSRVYMYTCIHICIYTHAYVNLLYICIIYTELLFLPGEFLLIYSQTFLVEIPFSVISLSTIMDIPMSSLWC